MVMNNNIKGIIFDLDDTLYDQRIPFKEAIEKVGLSNFIHVETAFKEFRHHSDQVFSKTVTGEWSQEKMYEYRFIKMLEDQKVTIEQEQIIAQQFQKYYYQQLESIKLIPDFIDLLNQLKSISNEYQLKIGIISNGIYQHQFDKCMKLQLLNWIDIENIIISGKVGIEKPNPDIFKLLSTQFNLQPQQCIYIGDNFHNDIIGSFKAGMTSVWFNHRNHVHHHANHDDITFITCYTPLEISQTILNLVLKK